MNTRRIHFNVLIVVLFLSALVGSAFAERIISQGDTWRFHNGFTFPGAGWNTLGYDDTVTGWFGFPSGFGFGDGDDATVLGDMQNGYAAFFTRKTFVVNNPAVLNHLTLSVDYDDGFVAFINGTEVARRNVSGTVTNTLVAAGNHEASMGDGASNPQEKEFIALDPSGLVAGTNVIAVSCHNVSLSSSDASLIVELYTNITLVRGPFIQMPVADQVTVVWRTDALTDSAVDYGLDTSYVGGTVYDSTLVREHVINIPGLTTGTNFYYRIRSGGVTLWQGDAFHTKRPDGQRFRAIILGDYGAGTPGMSNVAAVINTVTNADLFLTVGDNITPDGQPGLFDPYLFSLYGPTLHRVPFFPGIGNHDVATGGYSGAAYTNNFYLPMNGPAGQFLERNYSFDYANVHFATFDSNPFTNVAMNTAACNAIKTWLSNDLASTSKPWKLVYFHHPPYTSTSSSHSDTEGVKTNIMPICEAAGVQMVFTGHQHWFERMNAINGVYHITTGDGGQDLVTLVSRKSCSAVLVTGVYGFTTLDIDGTKLTLTHLTNGVPADTFNLDIGQSFKMDGLLDDPSWLRADNGLKLYAAIRGMYLYVATQDAGEGGDNFIYVNNITTTNRPANWAKAGQVMQWNAYLADENDNAFQGWFDATEARHSDFPFFQSMTSGLNNNGTFGNGVLEGTIDLTNRFGAFPQQLYLAAAAFSTADGSALTAQVPASRDGNGNVDANEFLAVNARDIALDLPVSNAGSNQTKEAGMNVVLNGSASSAPSGLPLSFRWTQLSGPPVVLVNSNSAVANFTAFTNVAAALVFQLSVNDTRFDSNAVTTVTLTPIIDSDGDGLSDQEEITGQDNLLTQPNPNGYITDPLKADTDGDGASDGDEAIAGTDPNSQASLFRVINTTLGGGGFAIEWSAVSNRVYRVQYRDAMTSPWADLTGDIAAMTPTTNVVDSTATGLPTRQYRVRMIP